MGSDDTRKRQSDFDEPFDDLFMWAVLTGRNELAQALWQYGNDSLAKVCSLSSALHIHHHRLLSLLSCTVAF